MAMVNLQRFQGHLSHQVLSHKPNNLILKEQKYGTLDQQNFRVNNFQMEKNFEMLDSLKNSRFTHGLVRWKKKDRIQLNSS